MKTYIALSALILVLCSCQEPKMKLRAVETTTTAKAAADSVKKDSLALAIKKLTK